MDTMMEIHKRCDGANDIEKNRKRQFFCEGWYIKKKKVKSCKKTSEECWKIALLSYHSSFHGHLVIIFLLLQPYKKYESV